MHLPTLTRTMADRCIFVRSGIPGLDQAPGGLPPPIISLSIHEKIIPRWWECQACKSISVCTAHQLHLNPLVSTTNPVTGLDNLDQPSLQSDLASSSFLESSSSDSDDIPNDKNWKPPKRTIPTNYRKNQGPRERGVQHGHKAEPSACHFCKRPMTLSSNLLNKSLIRICTLSGENLIPNRFIPAGIQCCQCARPHYLSSRPSSPQDKHHEQNHASKKSHITYQGFTAPDPRNPPPPCDHCLRFLAPGIHEKATQEACGGDCWVISAYGERLAKIKDMFPPVSLPWMLRTAIVADDGGQVQDRQGLLHRHERLCEEYITRCSLDLNREIAKTAGLHVASRERAARAVGRDHLRSSALGEGRVASREMVAAGRRVARAEEKVAEAKQRLEQVVEKIGEARVWVLGVLNGGGQTHEYGVNTDDSDGDEGNDASHDAEMDDFDGVDGSENGIEPAENHDGDATMSEVGEEQHRQEKADSISQRQDSRRSLRGFLTERNANEQSESQNPLGDRAEERNWHDEPEPEADPSYERYCGIKGIPFYETKPKRR